MLDENSPGGVIVGAGTSFAVLVLIAWRARGNVGNAQYFWLRAARMGW